MDMDLRAWLLNHRILVFLFLSLVSQILSWRLWLRQTNQPGFWFCQAELWRALELAAAAEPHLAVFTGDLVDRDPEFARLYREPLRALARVPHGVWIAR